MSQIQTCPLCGTNLRGSVLDGVFLWYSCWSTTCAFQCNFEDLPRIAAAMELAKATAVYAANIPPMGYSSNREFDIMQDAEDRVIEVFNG